MEHKKLKRRWDKAEIAFLQHNYEKLPIKEVAEKLKRSKDNGDNTRRMWRLL